MHRTNIYLTDEQCEALDRLARMQRRSRSAVIRDFVMAGLEIELDGESRVERSLRILRETAGMCPDIEMPDRSDEAARTEYLESIWNA